MLPGCLCSVHGILAALVRAVETRGYGLALERGENDMVAVGHYDRACLSSARGVHHSAVCSAFGDEPLYGGGLRRGDRHDSFGAYGIAEAYIYEFHLTFILIPSPSLSGYLFEVLKLLAYLFKQVLYLYDLFCETDIRYLGSDGVHLSVYLLEKEIQLSSRCFL